MKDIGTVMLETDRLILRRLELDDAGLCLIIGVMMMMLLDICLGKHTEI